MLTLFDIQAFHDDLDFVSVHDTLVADFRSALKPSSTRGGRQSLDSQVDSIVKAKAAKLSDSPTLLGVSSGSHL